MGRIAIIPARSGSKGLLDKNIKVLNGLPLLAWSVKAARDTGLFSEIMVSTDSERYGDIAKEYGASVPFLRSAEMASDTASSWDALREVLLNYKGKCGLEFEDYCLLQPTSPLRTAEDIKKAYQVFEEKNAESVISVCELEHSIKTINTLATDGCMDGFFDSRLNARRQDAETFYRINGAIYIQKTQKLLQGENIYGPKAYAFIMDRAHSVDIDNYDDFVIASALMRAKDETYDV